MKELWKVLPDFTKAFTYFVKAFTKVVVFVKDNASWLKWVAGFLGGRWVGGMIAPLLSGVLRGANKTQKQFYNTVIFRKKSKTLKKDIKYYNDLLSQKELSTGELKHFYNQAGKKHRKLEKMRNFKNESIKQSEYLKEGLFNSILGVQVFGFIRQIFKGLHRNLMMFYKFLRMLNVSANFLQSALRGLTTSVLLTVGAFNTIKGLFKREIEVRDFNKGQNRLMVDGSDKLPDKHKYLTPDEKRKLGYYPFVKRRSFLGVELWSEVVWGKRKESGLRWYPSFADKGFPAFSTLEEANLKTGGEGIGEGTKTTEDIITGGRRQTILNVSIGTVGQFEEVNVNGGDEAATDIGDKIYKALFEAIGGSTRNLASTV